MRIRLLAFALLAFCQLHLQQSGVLGQKYYMNFAFNNNNPNGGSNEGNGDAHPGTPVAGTPENHEDLHGNSGGHSDMIPPDTKSDEHEKHESHEKESKHEDEDVTQETEEHNKESLQEEPKGFDIDDDDSDSKDTPGRREKERQQEDQMAEQNGGHSHHSSYEISIDDSFGGRYVRSIYESSESHGHSGSFGGSGSRDKIKHDSSAGGHKDNEIGNSFGNPLWPELESSKKKKNGKGDNNIETEAPPKLYGNNDYEELN